MSMTCLMVLLVVLDTCFLRKYVFDAYEGVYVAVITIVVFGIPSCWIFIGLWSLFLVLRLIMMALVVLLLMHWFGTKVLSSRLVLLPSIDC